MVSSTPLQAGSYEIREAQKGEFTIYFHGQIDPQTAGSVLKKIRSVVKTTPCHSLTVDIGDTRNFDDFSTVVLLELKSLMGAQKDNFKIVNTNAEAGDILSNVNFDTCEIPPPLKEKHSPNVIVKFGESTLAHTINIKFMISFLGSVFLSFCFYNSNVS